MCMLQLDKKEQHCLFAVLSLSFLFYLWIAYNIPYAADDWFWGVPAGIRHFWSADQNSRYFGNLIELVLTRAPFLKTLFMAFIFTLIPAMATALSLLFSADMPGDANKGLSVFLLLAGNFFVLSMPAEIWQQTYGWVAGFSNFVVSACLLYLFYYVLCRQLLVPVQLKTRFAAVIGAFFLGLFLQLLLENITVYVCIVTILCALFFLYREKRLSPFLLSLSAGVLLGTVIMFSSGIYTVLFQDGSALNGYRQLTFDLHSSLPQIVLILLKRFFTDFTHKIWSGSWIICFYISLLLLYSAVKKGRGSSRCVFSICQGIMLVYLLLSHFCGPIHLPTFFPVHHLQSLMAPLYFLVCLIEILVLWRKDRLLFFLVFFWVSVPALIAPMVIVNTAGPRTFITSTMGLILFALLVTAQLWPYFSKTLARGLSLLGALALLVVSVRWCAIYLAIGSVQRERAALIRAAQQSHVQEIELPPFPYSDYIWMVDPLDEESGARFDTFYQIPPGTAVIAPEPEPDYEQKHMYWY